MPIDIETLRPLRKFLANFAVNGFRLLRQPNYFTFFSIEFVMEMLLDERAHAPK